MKTDVKKKAESILNKDGNAYSGSKHLYTAIRKSKKYAEDSGKFDKTDIDEGVEFTFDPENKGGIVIFSTDVNAKEVSKLAVVNWIKKFVATQINRFAADKRLNKIAEKYSPDGWTVGHFLRGRYKAKNGKVFDENSMSVEIIGLNTEAMVTLAEEICNEFKQESVLLKDYTSEDIMLVNGDTEKMNESENDEVEWLVCTDSATPGKLAVQFRQPDMERAIKCCRYYNKHSKRYAGRFVVYKAGKDQDQNEWEKIYPEESISESKEGIISCKYEVTNPEESEKFSGKITVTMTKKAGLGSADGNLGPVDRKFGTEYAIKFLKSQNGHPFATSIDAIEKDGVVTYTIIFDKLSAEEIAEFSKMLDAEYEKKINESSSVESIFNSIDDVNFAEYSINHDSHFGTGSLTFQIAFKLDDVCGADEAGEKLEELISNQNESANEFLAKIFDVDVEIVRNCIADNYINFYESIHDIVYSMDVHTLLDFNPDAEADDIADANRNAIIDILKEAEFSNNNNADFWDHAIRR